MIAPELLDQKIKERRNNLTGQMSLFDFVGEEEKKQYQIAMPDAAEFPKEDLLAFEKDILGVYVSGHPLDEYMDLWKTNITDHGLCAGRGDRQGDSHRRGTCDGGRNDNQQGLKNHQDRENDGLCDH